jgi:hypothetical protein
MTHGGGSAHEGGSWRQEEVSTRGVRRKEQKGTGEEDDKGCLRYDDDLSGTSSALAVEKEKI